MKFGVVAICLAGLVYSFAYADRPISYLCATALSTGFRVDETTGKWQTTNFSERKYILNQSKPDASAWYVRLIGTPDPIARCKSNPEADPSVLRCSGREEFWMDTKNLKFTVVYPYGYWDTRQGVGTSAGLEGKAGTPFIAIGTCSAL